jgi:hypothetical protein
VSDWPSRTVILLIDDSVFGIGELHLIRVGAAPGIRAGGRGCIFETLAFRKSGIKLVETVH